MFTIRRLTEVDMEAWRHLMLIVEGTLTNKEFLTPMDDVMLANMLNPDWVEMYGVFFGRKLVASAGLFLHNYKYGECVEALKLNADTDSIAEIGKLVVHPDYRGNNIGYNFGKKLLNVARLRGIRYVLSEVHPDNAPSARVFYKLGATKRLTYRKSTGVLRDVFVIEV